MDTENSRRPNVRDAAQWALDRIVEMFPKAGVRVEGIDTLEHSNVSRILVTDTEELSFIVKLSGSAGTDLLMRRELVFYKDISPLLPEGISPRCFFSNELDSACVLVLEDVEGHSIETDTPPSKEMIEQFVLALAQLHAGALAIEDLHARWSKAFTGHPYNTVRGRLEALPAGIRSFLEAQGERLDSDAAVVLKEMFGLASLFQSFDLETIVHGDAHFGNAVYGKGKARLIDWGNTALGVGEVDLAHAIAMNLPRSCGRQIEGELITLYSDYVGQDATQTWSRYRASVLYAIASSIAMREFGVPHWETLFENAMHTALEIDAIEVVTRRP